MSLIVRIARKSRYDAKNEAIIDGILPSFVYICSVILTTN